MGAVRKSILMLLLALLSGSATAEQYLCVPDKATGLVYEAQKKEWRVANFALKHKLVITPAKDGKYAFSAIKIGDKQPVHLCKEDFNKLGFLFCNGQEGDLKFNRNNGRYLKAFDQGYYLVGKGLWAETDQDSGTPYLEIGKCSPF